MTTQQGLTQADLAGLEPEDIVALDRMAAGDRNVARQLIGNILTTRMQERKLGQDWDKTVFNAQTKAEFLKDKAQLERELLDKRLDGMKDIANIRAAASLVQSPAELALIKAKTQLALGQAANIGVNQDFKAQEIQMKQLELQGKLQQLQFEQAMAKTKAEQDAKNDQINNTLKQMQALLAQANAGKIISEGATKQALTRAEVLGKSADEPAYNDFAYTSNRNAQGGTLLLDAVKTGWFDGASDQVIKDVPLPPDPISGQPMTPAKIQKTADANGLSLRQVLQQVYGKKIAEQITGENFDGYSWNKSN